MADLQSTNRTQIGVVRESTFGTTPANPVFKTQRTRSSNINANPQTVVSDEIRADGQVTDLILVGQQAQGDIAGELSFLSHDDVLEEALRGTWGNHPRILNIVEDTQISAVSTTTLTVLSALGSPFLEGMLCLLEDFTTAANNKLARVDSSSATTVVFPTATFVAEADPIPVDASIRVVGFAGEEADLAAVTVGGNALTSTLLDFTTLGIVVGDWVKIGSAVALTFFSGTTANNGWARVSAIVADRLSFDIVPAGWTADAGTGKFIRVFMGDRLRNGVVKRSNTIERQYLEHSPVTYEYLRGMVLSTLNLEFKSKSIVTTSRGYMGADGVVQSSRFAGASDEAAPTRDVLNTSSNVGDISMDGATVTGPNFVMNFTIEINNNMRMQDAVSSVGAVGIGGGEFNVSGSLATYFGSKAILEKVFNNTEFPVSLRCGRTDGNRETMLFDLPAVKLATGAPGIAGKNQDVPLDSKYQAKMHATLGYTIAVQRFWCVPA